VRQAILALALIILSLGIGFLLGDYYGGYATAFISALLSLLFVLAGYGISQGVSIAKWVIDYYSKPKLEYVADTLRSPNQTYYLRVKKTRGERAKNCVGYLALLPATRGDVESVWEHPNGQLKRDIDTYADLRLFQVDTAHNELNMPAPQGQGGSILFPSANSSGTGWQDNRMRYEDAVNLTIRVTVRADSTVVPKKPYEKKVHDIIVGGSKAQVPD